ncbi:MAG TPA: DoxX family protein [Pirellulales bacterium]|nr:DoxX family protein [Pirellulales bacterium]
MQPDTQSAGAPKWMRWGGYAISALIVIALLFSAVFKFLQPEQLVTEFKRLELSLALAIALGIIEATCAIIYAIPRTAVLGAILVTGYLGGAILTHVRIYDGFAFVSPLVMGMLTWLGLYLRDSRLRALIPLRR